MKTVLFVCTGNTYRSPMAACLFNAFCERQGDHRFRAISAGVQAFPGAPASEGALRAMKRRGLSLWWHRAQPVSSQLLESVDMIVCMSPSPAEALRRRFPLFEERIRTFSQPISDPFGGDDAVYEQTACTLETEIAALYHLLSVGTF